MLCIRLAARRLWTCCCDDTPLFSAVTVMRGKDTSVVPQTPPQRQPLRISFDKASGESHRFDRQHPCAQRWFRLSKPDHGEPGKSPLKIMVSFIHLRDAEARLPKRTAEDSELSLGGSGMGSRWRSDFAGIQLIEFIVDDGSDWWCDEAEETG